MGLRQQIEDNLAIWLFGSLATGFLAGIGTYQGILQIAQLEVVSRARLEALQSTKTALRQPVASEKDLGASAEPVKRVGAGQSGAEAEGSKAVNSQNITADTLPQPAAALDDNIQVVSGFKFELQKCKKQGGDIFCPFMVTNLQGDREIRINFRSRMIDSTGTEQQQCERYFGDKSGGGDDLAVELPSGIPSRFALKFCGVANVVNQIALLEVRSSDFKVQWRKPRL